MRRQGVLGLIVGGLLLVAPPAAHAAQVVTWDTTSRYVDPAHEPFNPPPAGRPPRANALRVNVYLPDGYDGTRRFPVLYLLHGHGDSYDSWVNPPNGDLLNTARGLRAIVVMPEGARGWYANWWHAGARSPAWERYHLDELIPLVQRRLRILPGRRNHAIAGLSMGGEGAVFYAEQRPGYFGSVAAFSAVLSIQRPEWPTGFDTQGESHNDVFGDPDAQRFYWSGHNPIALVANLRHTRTFVTVGDGVPDPTSLDQVKNTFGQVAEAELRQHADEFVPAARQAGVDVTYEPRHGIHDWPYWRAGLANAIRWGLFAPVVERPSSWRFDTVAQHSVAWGLTLDFATAPETVESFRLAGRTLTGEGSGTVHVQPELGPGFTATLPFSRTLPSPASRHTASKRMKRAPRCTRAPASRGPRRPCSRAIRTAPGSHH